MKGRRGGRKEEGGENQKGEDGKVRSRGRKDASET